MVDNTHAHPRFQFFDAAVFVSDAPEAVAALASLSSRVLVIESAIGRPAVIDELPVAETSVAAEPGFTLVSDTSGRYEFDIDTPAPVWFFLADANYPGWKAYINGETASLYSAQLLGKAVHMPAGQHHLVIAFEPMSFRLGLVVTSISLCLLAVMLVPAWRSRIAAGKIPVSQVTVTP